MNHWSRVAPYVWQHRQWLACSVGCALIAAILWASSMLLAFPIVKVLLQGKGLQEYFQEEIQHAVEHQREQEEVIRRIAPQLKAFDERPDAKRSADYVALLKEDSRAQSRLSGAAWREMFYSWLDRWLTPRLPADRFHLLAVVFLFLFVVTIFKGVVEFVQETLIGAAVERMLMSIREQMYQRVLQMDVQTLAHVGTPRLMSRFTFDLSQLGQGLSLLSGKLVLEPLKAVACITVSFFVNWQLTLLSLICAPLGAVVFQHFGRRLKKASRRQMESMGRVYQVLEETLRLFRVVLAYRGERRHIWAFHRANRDSLERALKIVRIDALVHPTTEFLGLAAVICALLPGAYLVLRHKTSLFGVNLATLEMDVAELSLLYTLLAGVLDPIRKLSSVFSKLKKAGSAADRVFSLLELPTQVTNVAKPVPPHRHAATLEFDRVTFAYEPRRVIPHVTDDPLASTIAAPPALAATAAADDADEAETDSIAPLRPVLEDLSITIKFGETVAIVGENGSGKSTLVNLIPRFYDPRFGSVRIDGIDLRQFSLRDLRQQLGLVTQETMLFDATIAENIAYGSPHATPAEIEAVARRAHVWTFAQQLPEKLDTPVGERGSRLSGGQRQRIALARALIRQPSVLILDEATSAIDAQSEHLIYQTLRETAGERTTLLVTHGLTPALLSTVTRVLVMDRGRAVAYGQHEDLLATSTVYQRIFAAQTQQRAA